MADLNSRVGEIIAARRRELREENEARRREIFEKFPRIAEIERGFDRTGLSLINCVLDGGCEPEEAVRRIMNENRAANEEKRRILAAVGYEPDYIEPRVLCEKCGDTGYSGGELCSCVKAELARAARGEANLSELLADQTFERFRLDLYPDVPDPALGFSPRENAKSLLRFCRSWAEGFGPASPNLYFYGGCGLGKTYLSSAVANFLLARGTDVLYISANTLLSILEDLHFNRAVSDEKRALAAHVNECELLILDDLGAEFATPFTSAELFRIINDRILSGKKTVISSNLSFNELSEKYDGKNSGRFGDRIRSRIEGCFEAMGFFGDDIRKKLKMEGRA